MASPNEARAANVGADRLQHERVAVPRTRRASCQQRDSFKGLEGPASRTSNLTHGHRVLRQRADVDPTC